MRGRGAVKTGSHRDAEFAVKNMSHFRLAFSLDPQGDDRGALAIVSRAVNRNMLHPAQPFQKETAQPLFMRPDDPDAGFVDKGNTGSQSGNSQCVGCSRLVAIRHEIRLTFQLGIAARPPHFHGAEHNALPQIKTAGAGRPEKRFMAGESKHVNVHPFHIKGKDPGRLGGVHHEKGIALFPAHGFQVNDAAGDIGSMIDDNELCIAPAQPRKFTCHDPAVRINRQQ